MGHFKWLKDLLLYGYKHDIVDSDIYEVLPQLQSKLLCDDLEKVWNEELSNAKANQKQSSAGSTKWPKKTAIKLGKKEATSAPGQKITESAKHRMTYGDINYLGSNKAFFYFDRGIRGKQVFINAVSSLKHQSPYKDIVFTSDCKCDSSNQHNEMFPHYRETCAVGLTCPARLSTTERMSYIREKTQQQIDL